MSPKVARAFVLVVAIGLFIGAITFGVKLVFPASYTPPISPQLATATKSSFSVTVNTTGAVVLSTETAVNFPSPGKIANLDVSVGQSVQKGTVLATLSSTAAQSAVSQAQANLVSAQARLVAAETPATPSQIAVLQTTINNAIQNQTDTASIVQTTASIDAQAVAADQAAISITEGDLTSGNCQSSSTTTTTSPTAQCQSYQAQLTAQENQLTTDQARSQSDATADVQKMNVAQGAVTAAKAALNAAITPTQSDVTTAQAAVTSAEASLQSAQASLSNLTLLSPISGTILQINAQVGQIVTGSSATVQVLPGTNSPISAITKNATAPTGLFIIGTSSQLVVGFPVQSSSVSMLHAGQVAIITNQATPSSSIQGKIIAVSASPIDVAGTSSYYGTASIPSNSLVAGIQVNISIPISQAVNVLSVPISAVYLLGGNPHIDIWNGHTGVPTAVTLGAQGTSQVQVTSGLRSGEQVVLVANQGFTQAGLA